VDTISQHHQNVSYPTNSN